MKWPFLLIVNYIYCQSNYADRILYQGIAGSPCTRLLQSGRVVGCQTNNGNDASGRLLKIADEANLEKFLSSQNEPTVLVMPSKLLHDNRAKLVDSPNIQGIITSAATFDSEPFSGASKSPNFRFGLYANGTTAPHPWNPTVRVLLIQGSGMTDESFIIPIFQLTAQSNIDLDMLLDVGTSTNNYHVQFDSFMSAGTDSATCLRRGILLIM